MQVVILEDSPLIRHLIVEIVSAEEHITVVAALSSRCDVVGAVRRYTPDALVYAVTPGDGRHLEIVRQIKRVSPSARVLVLHNDPCPECERRCLAAGAEAYLDKTVEFHRIPDVLNRTGEPAP